MVTETEASIRRKMKTSGQCAYEKFNWRMHNNHATAWEDLTNEEREAWFYAAVEGWKKITEANTDKRFA
jgi:hypothetical protein